MKILIISEFNLKHYNAGLSKYDGIVFESKISLIVITLCDNPV